MKKKLLTAIFVCNAFAFDISSLSSNLGGMVKSGLDAFNMDGESSNIKVDKECKNLFESYDINLEGLLMTVGTYSISNSSKIVDFLNKNNSSSKELSKEDFNKLATNFSRNYLWIPLEVEELYAKKIYDDRLKSGDVILKSTKNIKYKEMYKKLDNFLVKYNTYLKDNKLSYPYDIKIYILSTTKKAESLPYGYIFISEDYIKNGMYETILAHELSHVSKRHPTKEIQFRLVSSYDTIDQIAKTIKEMQSKEMDKKFLTGLMTPEIIKKGFEFYSKEQEIEADSCGLKTINAFIPNKINIHTNNFISNIEHSGHYDKKVEGLKNHPAKEERISNIKKIANSL
ncbi:M48 family metalloprotease [Aliarcobacter cryaerophilus]|uniref:M48 family metalloprotease n=1 Tax=Aliarcobacter cryaerophilus TaxID=28198 RepID=UPI003DA2C9FF